ncbi:MAG: NADPH-dependent reductase [Candidatus Doudnabacteria bacterium]|nr:NADPH-dependent reductase [Candidatus Doudnabacteria bacterium]
MKTAIILGSVRKVRLGERVAKWVLESARAKNIDIELLDLKEYPLPFFDEPESPIMSKGNFINPAAMQWGAKLSEFDAFIFVAPEYNYSYSGVLKNALDYVYAQFKEKPAAIISYSGGPYAGVRMTQLLRNLLTAQGAVTLQEIINIAKAQEAINEDGTLVNEHFKEALDKQLNSLNSWHEVLKLKRAK